MLYLLCFCDFLEFFFAIHFSQLNCLVFVQYIEIITHELRFIDKDNMIWYNIIKRIQFFIKEGYFNYAFSQLAEKYPSALSQFCPLNAGKDRF